jgi:hypothetical protein
MAPRVNALVATVLPARPRLREIRAAKADAYFTAVVDKMTALVQDTIAKWDHTGISAEASR